MAAITPDLTRRPAATIPVGAVLALVLTLALLFVVTTASGELISGLGRAGALLHETFHDGRHLLGVPCH